MLANYPSTMWLRAMADDYGRADPTPPYVVSVMHVQRDAMAGVATLTPVGEGYAPVGCSACGEDD